MQVGEKVRCIFPMCCGPGGSKSRLAKAAGAEPSGQMRGKKNRGTKHISKSTCEKHTMLGPLLESFCLGGARDFAPCQNWEKSEGFAQLFKNDGKRGAVEADLHRSMSPGRRVRRWGGLCPVLELRSIRPSVCYSDFAWQVQHFVWPGCTFSWQALYFREMGWKHRKTHWYEAVRPAFNFPCLKDLFRIASLFWWFPLALLSPGVRHAWRRGRGSKQAWMFPVFGRI